MVAATSVNGSTMARFSGAGSAHDNREWIEPQSTPRDWKKLVLVLGLGGLSWVATYVGMLELVQSNMGDLSLLNKIVIAFSVGMLMTMIIWLLDQMFAPLPLTTKLAYIGGYLFLTLISVGFGFGFYWKVLESRSEASRSAESAVSQVQSSLFAASSRLDQLQTTLDQLSKISMQKAVLEHDRGASCPHSRPGDGPRRKLRDSDAARFGFAADFVKGRGIRVKADMKLLDVELKKVTGGDKSIIDAKTGTRNKFLQLLTRKLQLTATGFNAFRTDPQLRQIRSELAERSTKTVFPTGRGGRTFTCPDPQLQSALRGVVRAIDQLPELGKPEIATVEGAQAVVEAFRRLTTTLYGVAAFKLPPSAEELRALQQRAVRSVDNAAQRQHAISSVQAGLSTRDYIPLGIALFVDLCLLLVSIGRPINRINGLVPKMLEAERGPIYHILSRFDEIHDDEDVRKKFEMFRHVVFDFNGDYYVAVPLDAPRNRNPEEAEKLQIEAHLLGNLFASFEKEKIFTRVVNPLLTRKTVKRKLQRQGSKYAGSEAFRTYRFKDGAWSDIILGAVMGAARESSNDRQQSAAKQGPTLDLPERRGLGAQVAGSQVPRAPTSPEQELGFGFDFEHGTHNAPAWPDSELPSGRSARQSAPVDPAIRAKFGRYASSFDGAKDEPENRHVRRRPSPDRWPYRPLPEAPSEADVDLREPAANNNTSPARPVHALGSLEQAGTGHTTTHAQPGGLSGDPSNVIPMPSGPRSLMQDDAALSKLTELANVATSGAQLSGGFEAAMQATVQAVQLPAETTVASQDPPSTAPMILPQDEPRITVRITERTADFSVPVTEAALPERLVANMAAAPMVTEAALPFLLDTEQPQEITDTVTVEASELNAEIADEIAGEVAGQRDIDDPMLRAAQRFAPKRPAQ